MGKSILQTILRSVIAGMAFFATVCALTVGYAAYSGLSDVNSGDALTKTAWNAVLTNLADLDSRWSRSGANLVFTGGNAGIGVSNPSSKLEVNGNFRATAQPHIMGTPKNTSGAGIANSFTVKTSRGGLSWSGDRINVPMAGTYLITLNAISNNTTGRVDANVLVNGANVMALLTEDNGQGHHQKSGSVAIFLNAGDYVQFNNANWYVAANSEQWTTASITLLH